MAVLTSGSDHTRLPLGSLPSHVTPAHRLGCDPATGRCQLPVMALQGKDGVQV